MNGQGAGMDRRMRLVARVGAAGLACVAFVLSGCPKPKVIINRDTMTVDDNVGEAQESPEEKCAKVLRNAVAMVQPQRLGLSSERDQASGLLNQWLQDCGSGTVAGEVGPKAASLLKGLLSSDELRRVSDTRFVGRDMDHVRTALLMKKIGDTVVKPADRDVDRVNLLFEYVVRNVALSPPSADAVALTPYEVLLFGRGTPADRAWVFAELLRQLRIDSVILRPGAKGEATPPEGNAAPPAGDDFLVGVLVEDAGNPVYLFDPWLGVSLPAPKEKGISRRPATLAQVIAEPALLEELAPDQSSPYRFAADALKTARVELIGAGEWNQPRMQQLQSVLSGEDVAVLYDPLDDSEDNPGALSRVLKAGGDLWNEAGIAIWSHPAKSLAGFEKLDANQNVKLAARRQPFDAPALITEVSDMAKGDTFTIGTPRKEQYRSRLAQLQGDLPTAVKTFQMVRVDGRLDRYKRTTLNGLSPDFVRMHRRADEDASFWTAVCQQESGEFASAALSYGDYLRRYPDGEWADHARGLQAECFAKTGKYAAAILALNAITESDPERAGHKLLLKRCRELRETP